ncbi:MAG: GAF domain-containing protein, partial [Anaerolineae bacterium]|nr:GAF domain-containing protein [Anaerolineae bacterium]
NLSDINGGIWHLALVSNFPEAYSSDLVAIFLIAVSTTVLGFVIAFVLRTFLLRLTNQFEVASDMVQQLAGDGTILHDAARAGSSDKLVVAAQNISDRIEALSQELVTQTARRNRDMRVAGRLGHEMVTISDLDTLANRAINLICTSLGYYHAQLFFVDDFKEFAILTYSRGEAGKKLLDQGHRIPLNVDTFSVVGNAARENRAIISDDTETDDKYHRFNPLLPDTRSELALPMTISGDVIGVLDIQSNKPHAFISDDLPTFQLIADQLAIAIHNARLKNESNTRVTEIEMLNRRLTREAWSQLDEDQEIVTDFGAAFSEQDQTLNAPIRVRGEEIGSLAIGLAADESFSDEDQIILDAVANRVALALENARLFQETQLTLSETSVLYYLSSQLNTVDSLIDVLEAIRNGMVTDANQIQLWLFDNIPLENRAGITVATLTEFTGVEIEGVETGSRIEAQSGDWLKWFEAQDINVFDASSPADTRANIGAPLGLNHLSTAVGVPLNVRGLWRGFIIIGYEDEREFNEREMRLFRALISQVSVTVDNRVLFDQIESALTRNERLYVASRMINTSQTIEDTLQAAIITSNDEDLVFWLGLTTSDTYGNRWPDQLQLIARTESGIVTKMNENVPLSIKNDEFLLERTPLVLTDDIQNADINPLQPWSQEHNARFLAMFPLFASTHFLGLFIMTAKQRLNIDNEDIDSFLALSSQMSTQIENKRLLERTETALNEARRLYAASRAIASAQDNETIFESIASHLSSPLLEGDVSHNLEISISLLLAGPRPSERASQLRYAFQWTNSNTVELVPETGTVIQHKKAPFASLLRQNNGIYHTAMATDEPVDEAITGILIPENQGEAVAATLRTGPKWFGVLIVRSNQPNVLNESYVRYLETTATLLASALDRQSLLSATEDERRNLDAILARMPTGVIVVEPENFMPVQHNAQAADLLRQPIDMTKAFDPAAYNLYRSGTNMPYPIDELALFIAKETNEPTTTDDIAVITDSYRIDMLMNAAPINNTDGSLRGIVVALQDISNIRNLENTLQETLRETVTMYEAQRAMIEATDVEELLDTIVVHMSLQQTDDIHVLLFDEETNRLESARDMILPVPDPGLLASMLSEHDNVRIDDVAALEDISNDLQWILEEMQAGSLLAVPMRSASLDRPLGWLVVTNQMADTITAEQERALLSLSDIASTALENRLLVVSTQVALNQTAQMYNASTNINSATDAFSLTDAIVETLRGLNADMFAIYLKDNTTDETVEMASEGFEESVENGLNIERIISLPLDSRDGLYIEDIATGKLGEIGGELLNGKTIAAFVALDLRVQDVPSGRFIIGYNEPRIFGDDFHRLMNTIVASASVVLDNQMLLQQIQSTLNETSTLYQASRALIEVENVNQIVDVIVNYLIEPHVNLVFIAVLQHTEWSDENSILEIAASWSPDGDVELTGVTLTPEQFPAWDLLATEQVITISDIYDEELGLDIMEQASIESLDARSVVIMPLRVSGRGLGAMWIGSREAFSYNDQHMRIFQSFAEQTSLSLEASRLVEQIERRARQLQTSAEISQRASQLLDMNVLLPQVVDLIQKQFSYDHVQIFLMDDADDWAVLKASTGQAGEILLGKGHKLQKGSDSVIGRVTANNEPAIALDTTDATVVHRANPVLPLTRSEMALPLTAKGKVLGALDVQSNEPNAFIEDDIQVLTTLAAQIAIAIDNANLYEDAQHRATDMSFLLDMTTTAASADTLDEALSAISERIQETMSVDTVLVYLPQLYMDFQGNALTTMKATAGTNYGQDINDLEEIKLEDSVHPIVQVTHSRRPTVINRLSSHDDYVPINTDAHSALLVPIVSGPELVGVLVLEANRPNAFNNSVVQLTITLVGSLAAVIQNTLLVEKLQQSNEQLRELDRLKSQFLAAMSHELRTPLNSIIGFSRVMLKGIDGPLTEMQEQDLSTIYNSGNHLLNLINDILDQAKIEANKMSLKLDYFEIKPMIESVKSMTIGLLKEKPTVDLRVEVAPNMPQAYGDEFRSRQILINLTNNAVKFTNDGTITIRAYATEQRGEPVIRIDVVDTGIGIAQVDVPILFEQFRQVDNSLTRTVGGTGLGLPLSKSLAELQGGELTVASEVNVGSTFSVTIPVQPTAAAQQDDSENDSGAGDPSDTKPPAQPASANGKVEETTPATNGTSDAVNGSSNGENPLETLSISQSAMQQKQQPSMPVLPPKRDVLLIEDDKNMVDQYRKSLQRDGFEVYTADHAAYAHAMASNMRPTIIVMDVNFADGQGWDILEQLKDRDDTFDIPVVIA